jgi:tetratricopeptide (TPR) repeat protein
METIQSSPSIVRRRLLLRDGITVLILCSVAGVLFGVTSFLFRSFENHRGDLAKRWSNRGQIDLKEGKPEAAISALRAALSYAPDDDSYQLLLASALADAGRTDEATNYFLNIWATRPGDGFVNLQLARLMKRKGDTQDAIEYYRASIFGNWQGDGTLRRRDVRLELASYLTEQHDLPAARAELSIVAGNAPDDPNLDSTLGDKYQSAGDLPDALIYYRKAIADDPQNTAVLEKGGRVAYALDNYATAHSLLTRALQQAAPPTVSKSQHEELASMATNAQRLLDLSLSQDLPPNERAEHILFASRVAKARLNSCSLQVTGPAGTPPPLQDLGARWKAASTMGSMKMLTENPEDQYRMVSLINDTELQTRQVCGPPTGDDALLLLLASRPDGGNPRQNQGLEK